MGARLRIAALVTGTALAVAFTPGVAGAASSDTTPLPAACAQGASGNPGSTTTGPSAGDVHFMRFAAESGLAEVASGQLAADHAQREETRAFGQRMVDEHGAQGQQLQGLAASFDVTLPDQPDAAAQLDLADLQSADGASFDIAYFQVQVAAHRTVLAAFVHEARAGDDACVREWAAVYVPVIAEHLVMARQNLSAVTGTEPTDDPGWDGAHGSGDRVGDDTAGDGWDGAGAPGSSRDGSWSHGNTGCGEAHDSSAAA